MHLVPQPKSVRKRRGTMALPQRGSIAISDHVLYGEAEELLPAVGRYDIAIALSGVAADIDLSVDPKLVDEEYRLLVGKGGIAIAGGSPSGVFWGVQTLLQLIAQSSNRELPCVAISDSPDFSERGMYLDVTRGRVPTLESFMQLAEHLAKYKINQLQIYLEHTFKFRGHPSIGKGASPMTAEEILELDRFCKERHIELVPSFASFGHMANVLKHPEYHHLAEDFGRKEYVDPEASKHRCVKGWSLAPANPDIYPFLDSLFAELLPLFSSDKFNACCDETWDLCLGQSYELGQKIGKGRVYLHHIKKLHKLSRKYGKKMQIWGDVVREHPELISEVPKGVVLLDWNYSSMHDFGSVRDFKKAGFPFYGCPGTSSWRCMFPRLHESMANIAGFAKAAKKNGARGLLNTDWGDGGHFNFMEFSWHGYVFGAEQSWNVGADTKSFTERFCSLVLGSADGRLADAIVELGDVAHLEMPWFYQAVWQPVFFALPCDKLFDGEEHDVWIAEQGKIGSSKAILNAKLGRETLKRLARVRKTLEKASRTATDPIGILPYWIFAVDTIAHAARKLTVLGPGGRDNVATRRALRKEMAGLMKRFEKLWMARSKRSEIRITIARYRKAIAALKR